MLTWGNNKKINQANYILFIFITIILAITIGNLYHVLYINIIHIQGNMIGYRVLFDNSSFFELHPYNIE